MTGAARHRAARAVARDGAIDERRIDGRQRGIPEFDPVEDAGPKALHKDVRIDDSPPERLLPALGPEIEGQELLAAVQGIEIRLAARQRADGIAGWRLNLGDVRALRLEQLGAVCAREQAGKIEDADAGKQHALLG